VSATSLTRRLFLRLLGLVYLVAFASLVDAMRAFERDAPALALDALEVLPRFRPFQIDHQIPR